MALDTVQTQRDLITEFLRENAAVFTEGAECAAPVITDYVWILAIQDALAPPQSPWYAVVTASDVTYRSLGLLEAGHDVLSAQDPED